MNEQVSERVTAIQQSESYREQLAASLEKAGLSGKEREQALQVMAERANHSVVLPSSYRRIYNYNLVALNEHIDDTHFTGTDVH